MINNKMDVSICIVNWNTRELLSQCIRSIYEKTAGITYEIIVVDNASSDGGAEMLRQEFSRCKLIESKKNLGFAKANNVAAGQATGAYILYLNPDTRLVTNALQGMHHFLEANREYGVVGCRLINADGSIQYTCAASFPTPVNEMASLFLLNRLFPSVERFSSRELEHWDHKDSRRVDCLSGACMMVRKEIIDELGGFDENVFMYAEDLDLCLRIQKEGWKVYYLSEELIIHYEGSGTLKRKDKYFASIMQNESNYYFIRKNYGPARAREYKAAVLIGSLFRILVAAASIPLMVVGPIRKIMHPFQICRKYILSFLWSMGLHKVDP